MARISTVANKSMALDSLQADGVAQSECGGHEFRGLRWVKYQAKANRVRLTVSVTGRHFAKNVLPANPPKPSSIAPIGIMQQRAAAIADTALAPIARTWGLTFLTSKLAFQVLE